MALVHFAAALPSNLAIIPPNLNGATKVQPVGAFVWNVGYGSYGTYPGTTVSPPNGARRAGTNIVDSYSSPYLIFDNDNTSGTEFECSTGPGDSGRPMFLQKNYQWRVAAIAYGADSRGFIDTDVTHENFLSTTTGIAFTPAAAPTALKWNTNYLNPTSNASSTNTPQDGAGNWDTSRLDFTDGGFTYSWENTLPLPVTFGVGSNGAGVVTVTTPINIADLTFAAPGYGAYNIAGTAANPLTLAAAGSSITVNANAPNSLISATLAGTGALTKLGAGALTLSASNTYTGGTNINAGTLQVYSPGALGTSGDVAVASGATLSFTQLGGAGYTLAAGRTLTNNGAISGTLSVSGTLAGAGAVGTALAINSGGVYNIPGGTETITGSLTNNGTIRVTGGAVLNASGATSFYNNGVLDLLAGSAQLPPAGFQNGPNGVVLTNDLVRVKSVARTSTSVTLTVDSYTGHNYQLQRGTSPDGTSFANLGNPQAGSTGTTLTFTDASPASDRGFYRVALAP